MSCQVMADTKKNYNDLMIINLYIVQPCFFLCILTFLSLTLGLMLYFWLVVRSAYMDLREAGPVLPVFVDEDTKIEKAGGKYIKM